VVLISPGAPDSTAQLLQTRGSEAGPEIGRGVYGTAHRAGAALVLKECVRKPWATNEDWREYCSVDSLRLNVSLATGLARIGDRAILPSGAGVTAPMYYGALVSDGLSRFVMSFEEGHRSTEHDRPIVCTTGERRVVYDAAMSAVRFDPSSLEGYDDTPKNLLVRPTGREVVKLDVANWETANPA
jgi:hypothetical protein